MDAVNDAPAPRRDSHRLAPFPPLMAARRAGQSGSGAAIGSTLDEVTLAALNTALAEATTANLLMDAITSSGRYRIVERFERRDRYHADDGTARRMALYIDVETTGLDTTRDSIIQLAVVPFEFSTDGRIFCVRPCEVWYEDPCVPLPELITELTGICDDDVRGKRIDDSRVEALLDEAVLVIAHNADFDRRLCEQRMPAFRNKYWACSCTDVAWAHEGLRSQSLEWLAYKQCGMFYETHRADSDCYMAVHLLSTTLPKSGKACLAALLESARQRTVRVWAVQSDKSTRFVLKQRRYRWNDGRDGCPTAWWKDVAETALQCELDWLSREVYNGVPGIPRIQRFDGRVRYSERVARVPIIHATEAVPAASDPS